MVRPVDVRRRVGRVRRCSGVFFGLATSDVAVLRATMWLPAVATLLLAIRACMDVGHRPWRVRRPVPRPTGARPA
jgi:hypothetical protein